MAIRKLVFYPDECLRLPTRDITHFDNELKQLVDDMFDTMYHAKGVGLAAPQIGLSLNLAVLDCTSDKSQHLVIANPVIIDRQGSQEYEEGCLSVPGQNDVVVRAEQVTVRAQDINGEFFEITGSGLLGECLQHEIDHLHGKLYIDLLSPLKRTRLRKKLLKANRDNRG